MKPMLTDSMRDSIRITEQRLDAAFPGLGAFLAKQLQEKLPEVLQESRPAKVGMQLFPLDASIPEGARSYTYEMMYESGRAAWLSSKPGDVPKVEVAKEEFEHPIRPLGIAAEWSLDEIKAAQFAGTDIVSSKMRVARDACDQFLEDALWNGDANLGIWGLFTNPHIPRRALSYALAEGTSADNAIATINGLISWFVGKHKGSILRKSVRLLVKDEAYAWLSSTPRSSTSDTTVLAFVVANNPYLASIEPAHPCEGAGTGGVDVAVLSVLSPERVRYRFRPPQALAMQDRGFTQEMPFYATCGGLYVPYPLYHVIAEMPA